MIFKRYFILFIFLLLTICPNIFSQELVYAPINPSFAGGNPFNAAWLMASAQAQNNITESSDQANFFNDPLADFQSTLKRQILSQITRNLFEKSFGEDGLTEGRYEFGDFIIDITPTGDGLQIYILDNLTGGETTVLIPYF